jgi:hypothetical protein
MEHTCNYAMVATKKHLNKGVRGDRKVCVWKGGQALGVQINHTTMI